MPVLGWLPHYQAGWLRFDLIAGLTAAAVVIPQAMAYATIAGLPIQVGLYVALAPMLVYVLLGTSRPLSVSSTSSLSLLTASALLWCCGANQRSRRLRCPGCYIGVSRGPVPGGGLLAASGLSGRLYLAAGSHRLQGRHRRGDLCRPTGQGAGTVHPQRVGSAHVDVDCHEAWARSTGRRCSCRW